MELIWFVEVRMLPFDGKESYYSRRLWESKCITVVNATSFNVPTSLSTSQQGLSTSKQIGRCPRIRVNAESEAWTMDGKGSLGYEKHILDQEHAAGFATCCNRPVSSPGTLQLLNVVLVKARFIEVSGVASIRCCFVSVVWITGTDK